MVKLGKRKCCYTLGTNLAVGHSYRSCQNARTKEARLVEGRTESSEETGKRLGGQHPEDGVCRSNWP